jgi:uncharacterized protein
MNSSAVQPIQQKQRIAIVDILRGWALLGVVLMNYVDYFYLGIDWKIFKGDLVMTILQMTGNIIFAAKSWTMLSFLFGYGFAVLMGNVSEKGMNAVGFFSRRMFWLLVLAFMNSALFFGDILKDYAVMGMVLLLFHRASARTAFISSAIILLAAPAVSAYIISLQRPDGMTLIAPLFPLLESHNLLNVFKFQLLGTVKYEFQNLGYLVSVHFPMMSMFLLGLAAQRINFFGRIHENKKYIKRIFWGTLTVCLLFVGLMITVNVLKLKDPFKYYMPVFLFIISSMLFFASALCWLFVAGKLKAFFCSLQVIGKMTLTNYITQNALAIVLFSGFGFGLALSHRIHFGYYMLFALVIYVAQVYLSRWWLARYYYGPIEWVWRQLSYNKRLPLRKYESAETSAPDIAAEPIPILTTAAIFDPAPNTPGV